MEKKENENYICRLFHDSEVNNYTSLTKVTGGKTIDSKYISISDESNGHKILSNRVVFFYDCGDNKLNVVRVKKEKASFSDHKSKIVDFALPPRSSMEIFSLDEDSICLRWGYRFKDSLQSGVVNTLQFEKPMRYLLPNHLDQRRILASWSDTNMAFTYFVLRNQRTEQYTFYLPTQDYLSSPLPSKNIVNNPKFVVLNTIKSFVFSTVNMLGYILHDANHISIIDFETMQIVESTVLDEFGEDIESIYFKDFNAVAQLNEIDRQPQGSLILTAKDNRILYTAEIYSMSDKVVIQTNRQVILDGGKKVMKIIDGSDLIFLVETQAPFKLFVIKVEAVNNTGKPLEMQAINKQFSYIYEFALELSEKLIEVLDFDVYLQEKKSEAKRQFMFFIRDKLKISLFAIDESIINTRPIKLNEEYHTISDEQSNESSKLKDLNIDSENKQKFAHIEKTLNNTSKMLAEYGKQTAINDREESKYYTKKYTKALEDDELGQINERETESGGNNEKNQQKVEEYRKLSRDTPRDENKQEERYENTPPVAQPQTIVEESKRKKPIEKEAPRRNVKVVEYNLESNVSDEAGGNQNDYSPEKYEPDHNEDLKDTSEGNSKDFINKVRASTVSKNLSENEYSKNKTRRTRQERENNSFSLGENEDRFEDLEESKENQSTGYPDTKKSKLHLREPQIISANENVEQTSSQGEDGQCAPVLELEDSKQDVEENKSTLREEKVVESRIDAQEEDKQTDNNLEQDNRQPSLHQKSSQKTKSSEVESLQKLEKKKRSDGPKKIVTYECTQCKTSNSSKNKKIEKSIEDLVAETLKNQLPELLAETVKQSIATAIVKQTKEEMAGLHQNNYKKIEASITTFAEGQVQEAKKSIEGKVKEQFNKLISEEFKKVFKTIVLPHCEKMVEETMTELIDTVKQVLEENETKVKEIEERVDRFIEDSKAKSIEPSSAPLFRSYSRKDEQSFENLFKTYDEAKHSPSIEKEIGMGIQFILIEPSIPPYMKYSQPPTYSHLSHPEYIPHKKQEWPTYGMPDYPQPALKTPSFSEFQEYSDPAAETKMKMMKGLNYFLEKNPD